MKIFETVTFAVFYVEILFCWKGSVLLQDKLS